MYCKKCGMPIPENKTRCPKCGYNSSTETTKVVIVAALSVIIIAVILTLSGSKHDDEIVNETIITSEVTTAISTTELADTESVTVTATTTEVILTEDPDIDFNEAWAIVYSWYEDHPMYGVYLKEGDKDTPEDYYTFSLAESECGTDLIIIRVYKKTKEMKSYGGDGEEPINLDKWYENNLYYLLPETYDDGIS